MLRLLAWKGRWPYKVAPADVYFASAADQLEVRRPDVYVYRDSGTDVSIAILVALAFTPLLWVLWMRYLLTP